MNMIRKYFTRRSSTRLSMNEARHRAGQAMPGEQAALASARLGGFCI